MTTLAVIALWWLIALAFALAIALPMCCVAKDDDRRAGIDLDS